MIIISILIVTVSLIIWRGGVFDLVLEDKSQQWSFLIKWPV